MITLNWNGSAAEKLLLSGFIYLMEKSVDPDQLASQKPADLDLHYFQRE